MIRSLLLCGFPHGNHKDKARRFPRSSKMTSL